MHKEWKRFLDKGVWDMQKALDWSYVASCARNENRTIHLGRVFGIMVLKGAELDESNPNRKYKYRVVFQGNNVVDQDWSSAVFQDLGSAPASMEAGKLTDF